MIDPPYPAETRARGWRFDLDYEQIEQSDTWDLAGAEARPWLLMLWFTAWKQAPCGSLPSDEQVIAAKIGMPARMWAKHRAVLLRGWTAASDGRLYHETLAARVIEMMANRRKESDRKALYRAGTPQDAQGTAAESQCSPALVPLVSHGTDMGLPPESTRNPTPTPTPTEKKEKTARKRANPVLFRIPDDFGISERVQRWAREKGHSLLEKRLEHFVGYARRNAKEYADWDEAFMGAIREDWAKLNGSKPAAADVPVLQAGQWA